MDTNHPFIPGAKQPLDSSAGSELGLIG